MCGKITIDMMVPGDAGEAIDLWKRQFSYFCKDKPIYPSWENNSKSIEKYITDKSEQGNAFGASRGGKTVGFLSFDSFNFHGAESAICHFCGNAASLEGRKSIYLALYSELAGYCADKGILTHYISICANDNETRDTLFDLGFGAYGADAFASLDHAHLCASEFEIGLASPSDAKAVYDLFNRSADYFLKPPICLRLEPIPLERIEQRIQSGEVFVAKDHGAVIGMMDVEIAEADNIYRMYTKGCAVVCGEIGAYILDDYRGRGIGSHFIKVILDYCASRNAPCAHVPWETANPFANRFWRKFFTPTVLALKRTLHPDIL